MTNYPSRRTPAQMTSLLVRSNTYLFSTTPLVLALAPSLQMLVFSGWEWRCGKGFQQSEVPRETKPE